MGNSGAAADDVRAPVRKTLRRHQRLTLPRDFKETFAQGRKSAGRYMVMWTRSSPADTTRLGVVASKRSIGKAFLRMRAKRRLREVFRLHRHELEPKSDVVLVARRGILEANWPDVTGDFKRLADKAGLIVEHHEKE